jgi:hypothetical protein
MKPVANAAPKSATKPIAAGTPDIGVKPTATLARPISGTQSRGATTAGIQPSATIQPRGPASRPPAALAATPANTRFALLGPFGDAVADTRPEFSWQPLAGATHYSIAIVDERLHPVQHSHALRTTTWKPRRPLRHGHTYLWQVTATLHGGKKVVASEPSEARLTIVPTTAKRGKNDEQ